MLGSIIVIVLYATMSMFVIYFKEGITNFDVFILIAGFILQIPLLFAFLEDNSGPPGGN